MKKRDVPMVSAVLKFMTERMRCDEDDGCGRNMHERKTKLIIIH